MRTPKDRFTESGWSGKWGAVVKSELFEEAIHTAMSQFVVESPMECQVPQQACDAHQQSIGARKLLDILCNLHVPSKNTPNTTQSSLNYEAGV